MSVGFIPTNILGKVRCFKCLYFHNFNSWILFLNCECVYVSVDEPGYDGYKTPMYSLSNLRFCLIPGNAFNLKSCEVATEIMTILLVPRHQFNSLVTPLCTAPIHNHPLFHRFPASVPALLGVLFRSARTMLCLVRPQSAQGRECP